MDPGPVRTGHRTSICQKSNYLRERGVRNALKACGKLQRRTIPSCPCLSVRTDVSLMRVLTSGGTKYLPWTVVLKGEVCSCRAPPLESLPNQYFITFSPTTTSFVILGWTLDLLTTLPRSLLRQVIITLSLISTLCRSLQHTPNLSVCFH
jgi:hypothetical protein